MHCYLYCKRVLHPKFQPYKLYIAILGKINAESKCNNKCGSKSLFVWAFSQLLAP